MKGSELIRLIQKNGWEDTDVFVSCQGYCSPVESVEALFPKLANTNDIVLSDDCFVEKDKRFWEMFYGTYMEIVDVETVRQNPEGYFVLHCDGTASELTSCHDCDYIDRLHDQGCLFGKERKEESIG